MLLEEARGQPALGWATVAGEEIAYLLHVGAVAGCLAGAGPRMPCIEEVGNG